MFVDGDSEELEIFLGVDESSGEGNVKIGDKLVDAN